MEHCAECDFPGSIEIHSAEGFYRKFLFDSESTHPMRNISSPSKNTVTRKYYIVRIKKVFVDSMEIFL